MTLEVRSEPNGFGASVEGFRANDPSAELTAELRRLWLKHQVLTFPDQSLTPVQLKCFSRQFGEFGEDPFIAPLAAHPHVVEVRREPSEKVLPFGGSWHSDWSFQETPPSATLLHAAEVPPVGGDTLFADGYRAYEALPSNLQSELEQLSAIHSARRPYTLQGFLAGGGLERSMRITPSDQALNTQNHPIVRTHPETGRKALWINRVYTISIRGLDKPQGERLLQTLIDHALQDRFVYKHRWRKDMLCMWDNRCTQHCAMGGYDGYRRVMHRTVIAGDRPV